MISDILSLYNFINKELESASILKALFSWDGVKKLGDEEIKINLSADPQNEKIWFYEISPYRDFIFVAFPTNPSVNVNFGKSSLDKNPDSRYFRYVSSAFSTVLAGGEENVKVDFMVFGYNPQDLMDKVSSRPVG